MLNDLRHLATGLQFGSINHDGRVIIAIDLTALDFLQPAIVGDSGHCDAFRRIGVQHCEEDTPECWWVDVVVEKADVGIVGLGDVGRSAVGVFGVPFLPASD